MSLNLTQHHMAHSSLLSLLSVASLLLQQGETWLPSAAICCVFVQPRYSFLGIVTILFYKFPIQAVL